MPNDAADRGAADSPQRVATGQHRAAHTTPCANLKIGIISILWIAIVREYYDSLRSCGNSAEMHCAEMLLCIHPFPWPSRHEQADNANSASRRSLNVPNRAKGLVVDNALGVSLMAGELRGK